MPKRPRSIGLACNSGSQASRLCSFRFAGETPASQDRGRLACIPGSRASRLHAVVLNR
ncbi:MAG: hypothetical protein LBP59_20385 [Planctomycetaceae bacterium]|nr:hypothetical protein [Planctomycetaceae bacterium]